VNVRGPSANAPCFIGVEIDGGAIINLIAKGARVPVRARKLFTTVNDWQEAVEVHIIAYSGGFEAVSIGTFLLAGIRRGDRGKPRIEISIELDADGLIHASARDLDTKAGQEATFPRIPARGEVISQRTRLYSLAHRLQREMNALPPSMGMKAEVEELVARSYASLGKSDVNEMMGCAEVLETLLGEIRALESSACVSRGKAGMRV
jgi:molecular chaperone DnaK